MSTSSYGSSLTQTSATPQSPLGALREVDDHASQYIYCYNATGLALTPKQVVVSGQDASTPRAHASQLCGLDQIASTVLGVAELAVPAGHYFWAKRKGTALVDTPTATVAGRAAICEEDGEVDDSATPGAGKIIGHIVVGSAGAGEITIWLDL